MDSTEAMIYKSSKESNYEEKSPCGPGDCCGNEDSRHFEVISDKTYLTSDEPAKRSLFCTLSPITKILIILLTLATSWYVMFTAYTIVRVGTVPVCIGLEESADEGIRVIDDTTGDYNWNGLDLESRNSFEDSFSSESGAVDVSDKEYFVDNVINSINEMANSEIEELENEIHLDPKSLDELDEETLSADDNLGINSTRHQPPKPVMCTNIPKVLRFDCHPQDGASQSTCEDRGCCWDALNAPKCEEDVCPKRVPLNIPYCYYPENWPDYELILSSEDDDDFSGFYKRKVKSYYKNDIPEINIDAKMWSESILRVKIVDAAKPRYEPLWPDKSNWNIPRREATSPKYKFEPDNQRSGFRVKRAEDNKVLFDTMGKGKGFIFADQFLEIHATLPSHNIYGLGEHRTSLKLDTNWQSFTMFNRDQAPTEQTNLYGTHPFYFIIEDTGNCHGVLFLNSNAMDVILQPAPAITFRTIGGIFDLYFFMGPTPTDVLRQYSEIVGKPFFPPYWSLGFHLCKFGYGSVAKTREVWNRTRSVGIPFDTQWNDIDYMDRNNDFTYDTKNFKELPQFVEELHRAGMHYIPMIDAGVSAAEKPGTYPPYDEGLRDDIFIKDSATNQTFIGKVWNLVSTAWPDFTHPKIGDYYLRMLQRTYKMFAFDGIWIDMNEPSNFYDGFINGCTKNDLDYPQYVPNVQGGILASKTLCMNAKHYLGPHYNFHNTHAVGHAVATNSALKTIRNKRPFIISRGSWEGLGYYAGHWTGDIFSTWHDLRMSVPEILSYSFFQVPMIGADICGFNGNTTIPLCNRWVQLGAFYPFSRNHNSDETIDQDPVAMGDLVVKSSRKALLIRYRFLPYLYTLFFRAHKFGDTVARPLFFEFINDKNTYDIDTQFLWGNSLMIIPVLEENKVDVTAYIPRGPWYDFYSKSFLFSTGMHVTLDAPLDTIPLLVRGGSILPAQTPNVTTTLSRKNKFELLVALDVKGLAIGEMYWDDGDSLDSLETKRFKWLAFIVKNQTLTNREVEKGDFSEEMILGKVSVMGVNEKVNHVFLNNNEIHFIYEETRSYLNIKGLSVDLKKNFILSWTYE